MRDLFWCNVSCERSFHAWVFVSIDGTLSSMTCAILRVPCLLYLALMIVSCGAVLLSSLLISCLDEDGSGSICEDEFVEFWHSYSFA
jgi:hypothetical protein